MALLADLETKRGELNTAISAYTQAVQSGVLADITSTKATAQSVGDEYAKLIQDVKKDDASVTNDDQLFSNPARMNALVRDDIKTIMTTGKLFGGGMKLLMDTEGSTVGATNVILSFAEGGAIDIDWGDGSAIQSFTSAASHNYAVPGQYTVEVSGTVNGFTIPLVESRQQLKDVSQWGTVEFSSAAIMFAYRTGFVISASDAPTFLPGASCYQMFLNASDFNSPIGHWDVSNVVSMNRTFVNAAAFNQPLNGWNVSGVTDMQYMFYQATAFNQPLNGWDVSSVTDMSYMFYSTDAFNQPLNSWNVSGVTNMGYMFYQATAFNQPLNNWNVSNVKAMQYMLYEATAFNQNLSGWTVSQVTNFSNFNTGSILQANYLPNF